MAKPKKKVAPAKLKYPLAAYKKRGRNSYNHTNLGRAIEYRGLSVNWLSLTAEINRRTLSDYLAGRTQVSAAHADVLAKILDCPRGPLREFPPKRPPSHRENPNPDYALQRWRAARKLRMSTEGHPADDHEG